MSGYPIIAFPKKFSRSKHFTPQEIHALTSPFVLVTGFDMQGKIFLLRIDLAKQILLDTSRDKKVTRAYRRLVPKIVRYFNSNQPAR